MAVLFSMPKPKLLVFYVPNLLPVWGKQLAIRSLARRPHESTRSHAVGFPIAETQGISWVQDVLCLGTLVFCPKVMCSSYPRSRPDLRPPALEAKKLLWARLLGGRWFMLQPWWEFCPLFSLPVHRYRQAEIKSFLGLLFLKEITVLKLYSNDIWLYGC